MAEETWKTSITEVKPNEVRLRGYRIDGLMGKLSFAQAVYLALMGELPSPEISNILDVILVSSIDHGATPPSALAARTSASTGAPLNAALAVGILSINRHHGGAIYDCMGVIQDGLDRVEATGEFIETIANLIVGEFREAKRRIPGIGHRIHTADPRTKKLFELAELNCVAGKGVKMIAAIQEAISMLGKDLPINVDGAIAALLVDMDIPQELANAFFIMARVPGLVAHIYEEQTAQRPMRRIHPTAHEYIGPEPREIS